MDKTAETALTALDEDLIRLVACEQWPETHPAPVRGSLGARFSRLPDGYRDVVTGFRWERLGGGVFVPRLDDNATLGCLKSMIEGFRSLTYHPAAGVQPWTLLCWPMRRNTPAASVRESTEGRVLVVALLRWWGHRV